MNEHSPISRKLRKGLLIASFVLIVGFFVLHFAWSFGFVDSATANSRILIYVFFAAVLLALVLLRGFLGSKETDGKWPMAKLLIASFGIGGIVFFGTALVSILLFGFSGLDRVFDNVLPILIVGSAAGYFFARWRLR